MSTFFTDSILDKEAFVYPGHPIVIAYCIVKRFKNWSEATCITDNDPHRICAALGSMDIPGAGGCVASALDFLARMRKGESFEEACVFADAQWYRCDSQGAWATPRYFLGAKQAEKFRTRLKAALTHDWLEIENA